MSPARVLLLGLGPTAASAFAALAERFDVVGLVRSGPPSDEVIALAQARKVRVVSDASVHAVTRLIGELKPDCVVVSSYDRVIKPELLARTRFVNVHYAPLPRYRGRANVNWTLINGETEAGMTIHVLAPELDAGNILCQRTIPIGAADTVTSLYARLNELQRAHLADAVQRHIEGFAGDAQDETLASYGCTRTPEDGEIDWSAPTAQIDRLIRALTPPYPGAFAYLNGQRLIIWRAEPVLSPRHYVGRISGRVCALSSRDGTVEVLTGDGVLQLREVQLEGSERVAAASVIKSSKITLGVRTVDLMARIHALEAQVQALLQERSEGHKQKFVSKEMEK